MPCLRAVLLPILLLVQLQLHRGASVAAVPAPHSLSCSSTFDGDGRRVGLFVTWPAVDRADVYSVVVGDGSRATANPFGWLTATATNVTIHNGWVGQLSDTAWVKVRAHIDGIGGVGNDTLWSEYSPVATCHSTEPSADPGGLLPLTATSKSIAPPTRFQRMYRITETLGLEGAFRPPDFLRDHNSADMLGSASFLTWAVLEGLMSTTDNVSTATITEYCVEMLDRPYAAYMSCVPGGNYTWNNVPRFQAVDNETCYCAKGDDRYITHRDMCTNTSASTPPYLRESCPLDDCEQEWSALIQALGPACTSCSGVPCTEMLANHKPLCTGCNASQCAARWAHSHRQAEELSRQHERRRRLQGWNLPCNCSQAETEYGLNNVGATTLSFPPGIGTWFSTPKGGQCPEGQPIGTEGCTWRRESAGRILYGYELVKLGFTRPDNHGQSGGEELQRANGIVFRRALEALPISQYSCGPTGTEFSHPTTSP